jgi:hypothetical protein
VPSPFTSCGSMLRLKSLGASVSPTARRECATRTRSLEQEALTRAGGRGGRWPGARAGRRGGGRQQRAYQWSAPAGTGTVTRRICARGGSAASASAHGRGPRRTRIRDCQCARGPADSDCRTPRAQAQPGPPEAPSRPPEAPSRPAAAAAARRLGGQGSRPACQRLGGARAAAAAASGLLV